MLCYYLTQWKTGQAKTRVCRITHYSLFSKHSCDHCAPHQIKPHTLANKLKQQHLTFSLLENMMCIFLSMIRFNKSQHTGSLLCHIQASQPESFYFSSKVWYSKTFLVLLFPSIYALCNTKWVSFPVHFMHYRCPLTSPCLKGQVLRYDERRRLEKSALDLY